MSDGMPVIEHACSAQTRERCPECGHEDTRDGFEGFEAVSFAEFRQTGRTRFVVRCAKCEALHPDQSDHDEDGCDACYEEELIADA